MPSPRPTLLVGALTLIALAKGHAQGIEVRAQQLDSPAPLQTAPMEISPGMRVWLSVKLIHSRLTSRGTQAAANLLRSTALSQSEITELLGFIDEYHEAFQVDTIAWRRSLCQTARQVDSDDDLKSLVSSRKTVERQTREGVSSAVEHQLGERVARELAIFSERVVVGGSDFSADDVARQAGISYRELVLRACESTANGMHSNF